MGSEMCIRDRFFGLSYTYALSGGDSDLVGTIGKFLGGIFKLPGLPG